MITLTLSLLLIIQTCYPISIIPNPRPHFIPASRGRSSCSLQPLRFGYYLGVNPLTYSNAVECCVSKNLDVAQLDGFNMEVVKWVLVTGGFSQGTKPIGKLSSLWVNSTGGGPCTAAYLNSWTSPVLKTHETDTCDDLKRYLCNDRLNSQVDCYRVQYTEFHVDGVRKAMAYSGTKLPWIDALSCCESRSQTLLHLHPSTTPKILQQVSRFGGTPLIWTAGYKSLDLLTTNHFKWTDNNDVSILHNAPPDPWHSEICVAAELRTNGIVDHLCEDRLNYVCDSESPPPCDDIDC